MINIIIGGDVCPINRNLPFFKRGDSKSIFNDLLIEFENSDLAIINLECPLINEITPIRKYGPVLGVESDCITGIKAAGINVVNLANNHIFDHGWYGLKNTLTVCENEGISTVGAGKNLGEAGRILIKEIKGLQIGILGVAEHEFSIATEDTPGANPLDLIDFVRKVNRYRKKLDYFIVLVHAGNSGYPLPSPRLLETCRFMAEMGANAIICQHSHCSGSFENYENSYIVYGQGNLIFDWDAKPGRPWNKGYLVKIEVNEDRSHNVHNIPYIQSDITPGARRMTIDEESAFLKEIVDISFRMKDKSYVQQKWRELCNKEKHSYYYGFLFGFVNSRIIKMINRNVGFMENLITKKHLLRLENMIRCDSHREMIETIFEERRKET